MTNKGKPNKPKSNFHAKNKHQGRYDLQALKEACPELVSHVKKNNFGVESINFFDAVAVKTLNKALLKDYYGVEWDIPNMYLCPPIPGRADYIHHVAQLLGSKKEGSSVKCLDIGVGANSIYPIIGFMEYGWSFVGSDTDVQALESAKNIVEMNPALESKLELRYQSKPENIFYGIIKEGEKFDLTICNPPYHKSQEEAEKGNLRKLKNLKGEKTDKVSLNFGGKSNELWCEGGEVEFVKNIIRQSKVYSKSCTWFTTLVSKETNLKKAYQNLEHVKALTIKTIPMGQGQKQSRILAWSFTADTFL